MKQSLKDELERVFLVQRHFSKDVNHVAACTIFTVLFDGNLDKWNKPQDKRWVKKYNSGLIALADIGLIVLCAKQ